MALSAEMKDALAGSFHWKLTNVPELESPVLMVFDYSPRNEPHLASIAFDYSGGPKCWLSESKVRKIGDEAPNPHPDYRMFVFDRRTFHPYSIQAFPPSIFEDIHEFKSACHRLYQHVVWSE